MPRLVPELYGASIERSVRFYTEVLGFAVRYSRPEERFAYLDRDGAEIMLEESIGRVWLTGELQHPYGRGVNFQIQVDDVEALYEAVKAYVPERPLRPNTGGPEKSTDVSIFLEVEDKWYRCGEVLAGNRQFIVQDPDGYLLQFFEDLGEKSIVE